MNRRGTAVITGASKGIGKEMAIRFAREGFDLIICARTGGALADFAAELNKNFPERTVHYRTCDLSVKEDVQSFGEFIKSKVDLVHVIVNNAGLYRSGSILEEPDGILEDMLELNVGSAYHLTRSLHDVLATDGSGHIFNICSIASLQAVPDGGSYAISKFALYGFSKTLREEMKKYGVRVTAVLPGATLTSSWNPNKIPEERYMRAVDVAEAVWACYNLSPRTVVEDIVLRPMLGDI